MCSQLAGTDRCVRPIRRSETRRQTDRCPRCLTVWMPASTSEARTVSRIGRRHRSPRRCGRSHRLGRGSSRKISIPDRIAIAVRRRSYPRTRAPLVRSGSHRTATSHPRARSTRTRRSPLRPRGTQNSPASHPRCWTRSSRAPPRSPERKRDRHWPGACRPIPTRASAAAGPIRRIRFGACKRSPPARGS